MRLSLMLSVATSCILLISVVEAFQPLMTVKRTISFAATRNSNSQSFSDEDFDSSGNFVGAEYAHILDDGKGHIRSDLATSIWNWDHDHNHPDDKNKKFKYSTRAGLKIVDEIARELLDSLSTKSFSSTSSSSNQVADDSSAMSYADLVQEGVVALMHCMANFDASQETTNFETYARKKIYNTMSRALADDGRPIRLPAHVHAALKQARKQSAILTEKLGREPSFVEIADAVGISPEKLEFYQLVSQGTVSMESTVEVYDPLLDPTPLYEDEEEYAQQQGEYEDELGEEELYEQEGEDEMWVHQEQIAGPLREFIPDEEPTPDDLALESMIQHDVDDLLVRTLDERELQIIKMRYGIGQTDKNKGQTLEEIASVLKLSKQRVAQIEERAMEKLRTSYTNRYVETYLDDEEHESIVDSV